MIGDDQQLLATTELDQHRGLVAHRVIAHGPARLAGGSMKGSHRVTLATGGHDHLVAKNQGRGGIAVRGLGGAFLVELTAPPSAPLSRSTATN